MLASDGVLECVPRCTEVPVVIDENIVDFGMRDSLLCAITNEGQLRCRNRFDEQPRVAQTGVAASVSVGKLNACVHLKSGQIQCYRANNAPLRRWGTGSTWKLWSWEPHEPSFLDVAATEVGWGSAFFVRTSGDVWFVGLNPVSMAGAQPPARFAQHPVRVAALSQVVAVAAALSFACAIDRSGEMRCWGLASAFSHGSGPTLRPPTQIAAGSYQKQIAGGQNHVCALDVAGVVTCLGDFSLPDGSFVFDAQRTVLRDERIVQIATGAGATCALFRSGRYDCWGGGWNLCRGDSPTWRE